MNNNAIFFLGGGDKYLASKLQSLKLIDAIHSQIPGYFHTWGRVQNLWLGEVEEFNRGTNFRCTFSYPNWVFVFMASVNYISRCHGSFLNYVTCHELYWGHWWETNAMNALYTQRRKNTDNIYQASDFNSEACKTQAPMRLETTCICWYIASFNSKYTFPASSVGRALDW